ncbi:MAG: hypothetical protein LBP59_03425 [Planctomycetaceae bacterium]|nr:hypothetical protein [Planctomycetaceae bacterium]
MLQKIVRRIAGVSVAIRQTIFCNNNYNWVSLKNSFLETPQIAIQKINT